MVGNRRNDTIQAAQDWALYHFRQDHRLVPRTVNGRTEVVAEPTRHLHILRYDTNEDGPEMTRPRIGVARVGHPSNSDGDRVPSLVTEWSEEREVSREEQTSLLPPDCCHFDEVMIMFHGHQDGVYEALIEHLPYILNRRPARRVVLWSCQSGEDFFPRQTETGPPGVYERLLGVFRPKDCPCGCDPSRCRAINADGNVSRCPTSRNPVTVLTAGYYEYTTDGEHGRRAHARLGIQRDGRLTSPDGRLREITVNPDGSVTASMTSVGSDGNGVPVIGTITAGRDPGLASAPRRRADAEGLLRPSRVEVAPDPPASGLPRVCPLGDGCIPDTVPAAATAR